MAQCYTSAAEDSGLLRAAQDHDRHSRTGAGGRRHAKLTGHGAHVQQGGQVADSIECLQHTHIGLCHVLLPDLPCLHRQDCQ